MITIDQDKLKEHKNAIAKANREQAYKTESDHLFFKWQRGEITEQEYLEKVEEIRQRFPYEGDVG